MKKEPGKGQKVLAGPPPSKPDPAPPRPAGKRRLGGSMAKKILKKKPKPKGLPKPIGSGS